MSDVATASLILAAIVVVVAVSLAWREWRDRRDRATELSPEDARHFGHQDFRRFLGIVVLILLAVGVAAGSRISPRLGNRANPQFLGIWLGVFLLIFVLLSLAMIDWLALRLFVRRQRNAMVRERIEILREEARLKKATGNEGNGHPDGPLGDLFQ